jgi:hypothetical protein
LVPGKRIDIVPVDPDGRIEEGLKFVLLDDIATADGTGLTGKSDNRYHKSTEELSGGQRALLGLSFVFAAALHKRSPLYLLDEVSYMIPSVWYFLVYHALCVADYCNDYLVLHHERKQYLLLSASTLANSFRSSRILWAEV